MNLKSIICSAIRGVEHEERLPRYILYGGLFIAVLLAAGLRIVSWQVEPVLSRDAVGYVQDALSISRQSADSSSARLRTVTTSHRLYSLYLSSRLFGLEPHQLGLVTNIVAGSLMPLLMFGIAMLLWKHHEIALICAFLAAVYPPWVKYSVNVQREIPHIFFWGCFLLSLLLFFRFRYLIFCMAMGISSALCLASRYEGAETLLISSIFFLVDFVVRRGRFRRQSVCGFLCYFASFFIVIELIFFTIDFSMGDFVVMAWKKAMSFVSPR